MKWSNSLQKEKVDTLVLVLQRTQLVLYLESKNSLTAWKFEPLQVRDLEILDEDAYRKSIEKVLKQLNLNKQYSIVLILDNSISFTQPIDQAPANTEKLEANDASTSDVAAVQELHNQDTINEAARLAYAQKVPFTNTFSTVLQIGKEKIILAVNRDLYEPIVATIESLGLKLTHILPMAVLTSQFSDGISEPAFQLFLKNIEKYKQYNLLQSTVTREVEPLVTTTMKSKEHPQRVYMLIGLFAVLILIFGLVWYWSQQRNAADLAAQQALLDQQEQSLLETAPAVEVVEEVEPIAESIEVRSLSEAVIEVQYVEESQEQAVQLVDILEESDVSVTLVLSAQLEAAEGESLLLVRPTVTPAVRDAFLLLLEDVGLVITVAEDAQLGVDMRLVI